jgi:hypothetical protein
VRLGMRASQSNYGRRWTNLYLVSWLSWSNEKLLTVDGRNLYFDHLHLHHFERRHNIRLWVGMDPLAYWNYLLFLLDVFVGLFRFSPTLHMLNPAVVFGLQIQGVMFTDAAI